MADKLSAFVCVGPRSITIQEYFLTADTRGMTQTKEGFRFAAKYRPKALYPFFFQSAFVGIGPRSITIQEYFLTADTRRMTQTVASR